MTNSISRRKVIAGSLSAGAVGLVGLTASGVFTSTAPAASRLVADKKRAVVMGVNGRGSYLAKAFHATQRVDVTYVCDVDSRALERAAVAVEGFQGAKPKMVKNIRDALKDTDVDILICAAPNHWHAPATILGCSHGKHVYVEKPCSHTAEEGELAIAAARKHKRIVQMGSQRRSFGGIREALDRLSKGEIGRVHLARTWYNNRRPSIGHGKQVPVPEWLDWTLWQGPAPQRPFKDNVVHYNWHWHWHWGNGELGNNGIHALDVARWGMQVTFPKSVTSAGTKLRHDDDQETPDTHFVTFDFADNKTITFEGVSWSPYGSGGSAFGISFHGEEGTMLLMDNGFKIFDPKNKEVATGSGSGGDQAHFGNFLDCIDSGKLPNADIEEAHRSTLLCHLGNISQRVGRTLHLTADAQQGKPTSKHFEGDAEADRLWAREYQPEWKPVV